LPHAVEAEVLAHIHPSRHGLLIGSTPEMPLSHVFRLCVRRGCSPVPAMTESPFAWLGALPPPRRAWSALSIGATRPSSLLRTHAPDLKPLAPSTFALSASLCRLLRDPAGRRSFPAFSPPIFPQMLGPLPRRFSWCTYPLLPRRQRPLPTWERLGNTHTGRTATSVRGSFSGLQTFAHHQCAR